MGVEEEGDARGEVVHIQPTGDGRFHIGCTIGQGEGQFLSGGAARLADVIAADADRVPLRHMLATELDSIYHQTHALLRREDILVLGDILLKDVVLERAAQLAPGNAALLGHR